MEKTPRYKVLVSDRARHMLAAHVHFLAEKSPEAARRTKNELMAAIRSLAHMPERFPFFIAEFVPPNKYHKMVVEKWHLVLYQIKDRTVYVTTDS
jgi:plasmid stabilization system protein ParE